MSETQILTIALAAGPTMLAVLAGILVNNFRLSEIDGSIAKLRSQMDSRFDDIERRFEEIKS